MKTERTFKSTDELVGTYISSRWNGMSDIYKVVGATPKGLKLEECELDSLGIEDGDPTWLKFKIAFDENGCLKTKKLTAYTKVDGSYVKTEQPNVITKRVRLSQNGEILMPKIGWDGCGSTSVIAMDDAEAKNVVVS